MQEVAQVGAYTVALRLHGGRVNVSVLGVGNAEQDRQTNLDRRREVEALVKVVTESDGAGARLGRGWRRTSTVTLRRLAHGVGVVPCAKPVMLENETLARAHETVRTNKGELIVIDVDVHVTPRIRRDAGQV